MIAKTVTSLSEAHCSGVLRMLARRGAGRCWGFFLLVIAICGVPALRAPAHAADPLPEAGGLTALPEEKLEPVALADPGFEEQGNGWTKADAFSIVSDGPAHSGKACLRLDNGQKTRYFPSVRQPLNDLSPGAYVVRLWTKAQGVPSAEQGPQLQGGRFDIQYQTKDGQRRGAGTGVLAGTFDWRQQEIRVLIGADVKPGSLNLVFGRHGMPTGGEVFFDDVMVERILPPPIEAFLLYPNYRGFLPEDGPAQVRVAMRVHVAQAQPAVVEATSADDGRSVASVSLPPGTKEQEVTFDSRPWPRGRYFLRARLGDYQYPAYLIHKISRAQRQSFPVWFDAHQVLYLNGRPAFVLGIYNTLREFGQVDDAEFERLKKMAEAPLNMNINYTEWGCDTAAQRRYLGEMQKYGIWFLYTANPFYADVLRNPQGLPIVKDLLPNAPADKLTQEEIDHILARLGQSMREMPGHAGWYVMDERRFVQVAAHFHQYQVLRQADPLHPTYGVSCWPDELFCWRDTLDVCGMDPYPLLNMAAGKPLSLVGEWTRTAAGSTQGSRPIWMVIQYFQGWSKDRWPTEEELRTMSLMAITEGARGLFYWSFGQKGILWVKDPQKREEYWQGLLRVTRELKSLEPALVAADAPEIIKSVSQPAVRWRARQADGKWYVFAYLPAKTFSERSTSQPVEVCFTLKDGRTITKSLRPDTADWFQVEAARP